MKSITAAVVAAIFVVFAITAQAGRPDEVLDVNFDLTNLVLPAGFEVVKDQAQLKQLMSTHRFRVEGKYTEVYMPGGSIDGKNARQTEYVGDWKVLEELHQGYAIAVFNYGSNTYVNLVAYNKDQNKVCYIKRDGTFNQATCPTLTALPE